MIYVKKHPAKLNTLRLSISDLDKSYDGYRLRVDGGDWIYLKEDEIKQIELYPKSAYVVEGQVLDGNDWVSIHGASFANEQAWMHQRGGYNGA